MNTTHIRARSSCVGGFAAALTAVGLLTACGAGGEDTAPSPSVAASASVGTKPATSASPTPPLFDDSGRPLLSSPSAQPADTAARTRQGLYASRDQLEWQELTEGIVSIVVDVDAEGGVEAAVHRARMLRAWHGNDGVGRVYYVRGRDLSAAARVVDTLSDEGFGWVYMVH